MQDLRVLFLGTSAFALPSLGLLAQHFPGLAVVTRPDRPGGRGRGLLSTPVKNEAVKFNLPVFQPENHAGLLKVMAQTEPHVLVNVAFGMFLKEAVLNFPPLGCINLHPSLLPAYRGAAPMQRALMAGEKKTGVTVLYMTLRLDAGDIIFQEETALGPLEDYGMLHDRLALKGSLLLDKAVRLVAKGEAPRQPQDEAQATFAPTITREEEAIPWSEPALSIHNRVRALSPAPGAYTFYRGKRLKIWATACAEEIAGPAAAAKPLPPTPTPLPGTMSLPGTICAVGSDALTVATGRGTLKILELQLEGKKRMDSASFLKGFKMEAGEKFA